MKLPPHLARLLKGKGKSNRSKYGVRTDAAGKAARTAGGILFASKKECKRYLELKALQAAGKISELRTQARIPLHCRNGIKVCEMRIDFFYHDENGEEVWEDVKGGLATMTPMYRLKKKWARMELGIEIREV